jgi:hypothetical protein
MARFDKLDQLALDGHALEYLSLVNRLSRTGNA